MILQSSMKLNDYDNSLTIKKLLLHYLPRLICTILILFLILIVIVFILRPKSICLTSINDDLISNIPRVKKPLFRWNSHGITIAGVTKVNGNASHLLNYPRYVTIDRSSALYVTDRLNNRVQKFAKDQLIGSTVAGHSDGTYGSSQVDLMNPVGLLVDSINNIYIGDSANMRIQFWPENARIGSTIADGINSSANSIFQLQSAYGLDYDSSTKTLYVADRHAHCIVRFKYNSTKGDIVAGGNGQGFKRNQLHNPYAVIFDRRTKSLLIANAGANNVVRWKIGARRWSLIVGSHSGMPGNSARLLQWPADIKLDPMGNLYVADRFNHRIQMFLIGQSKGITIAGRTGKHGSDSTHLNNPLSLAFDNQLNLYVADHDNHRVQKFVRF